MHYSCTCLKYQSISSLTSLYHKACGLLRFAKHVCTIYVQQLVVGSAHLVHGGLNMAACRAVCNVILMFRTIRLTQPLLCNSTACPHNIIWIKVSEPCIQAVVEQAGETWILKDPGGIWTQDLLISSTSQTKLATGTLVYCNSIHY